MGDLIIEGRKTDHGIAMVLIHHVTRLASPRLLEMTVWNQTHSVHSAVIDRRPPAATAAPGMVLLLINLAFLPPLSRYPPDEATRPASTGGIHLATCRLCSARICSRRHDIQHMQTSLL